MGCCFTKKKNQLKPTKAYEYMNTNNQNNK